MGDALSSSTINASAAANKKINATVKGTCNLSPGNDSQREELQRHFKQIANVRNYNIFFDDFFGS